MADKTDSNEKIPPTKYAKKVQWRCHIFNLVLAYFLTLVISWSGVCGFVKGHWDRAWQERPTEGGFVYWLKLVWKALSETHSQLALTSAVILIAAILLLCSSNNKIRIAIRLAVGIVCAALLFVVVICGNPLLIYIAFCTFLYLTLWYCAETENTPQTMDAGQDLLNRQSIIALCVNYIVKSVTNKASPRTLESEEQDSDALPSGEKSAKDMTIPRIYGARIVIYDEWGAGKSFVLAKVRERLSKEGKELTGKKIRTVMLDPWSFETPDEALEKMAESVESALLDFRKYPLVKNKYIRKLLVHLQQYLPGNSFTGSLYSLICHPDDVSAPARIKTIDENLDEPVVLFIDDMERAMPEIMKALLAALDRIREIKNLHIVAAIEKKAFTAAFDNRETAIGYLNKVFTHSISLPLPTVWDLRNLAMQRVEQAEKRDGRKYPHTKRVLAQYHEMDADMSVTPKTPRGILQVTDSMLAMEYTISDRYKRVGSTRNFRALDDELDRMFDLMYYVESLRHEFPDIYADLSRSDLNIYINHSVLRHINEKTLYRENKPHDIDVWRERYPASFRGFSSNGHALSYARFLMTNIDTGRGGRYPTSQLKDAINLLVYRNSCMTLHETKKILQAASKCKDGDITDLSTYVRETLGLAYTHNRILNDFWNNMDRLMQLSTFQIEQSNVAQYMQGLIHLANAHQNKEDSDMPPVCKLLEILIRRILRSSNVIRKDKSKARVFRSKRRAMLHLIFQKLPIDIFAREWRYLNRLGEFMYHERARHDFLACYSLQMSVYLSTAIFNGQMWDAKMLAVIADCLAQSMHASKRLSYIFAPISIQSGLANSFNAHILIFDIAIKMNDYKQEYSFLNTPFMRELLQSASELEPSQLDNKQLEQARQECDYFLSHVRQPAKGYKAVSDLAESFMKKVAALDSKAAKKVTTSA